MDKNHEQSDEDICGDVKVFYNAVVNGSQTFDSDVVNLTDSQVMAIGAILENNGYEWMNVCTATLISDRIVLTAAHCIVNLYTGIDNDPDNLAFAVGIDVSNPDYIFYAEEAHSHPDYNINTSSAEWDVGILVLKEPASEAMGTQITPLAINTNDLPGNFLNTNVQNVGYGSTSAAGDSNNRKWWTVEEVINVTDYDFTVSGHGYSSVCSGDSGGPSLWTFSDSIVKVSGTVSGGNSDCVSEDHFARVDYNYSWIKQYLDEFDPCQGITLNGECSENIAKWCENNQIQQQDCSATGYTCQIDNNGNYRCNDPCQGETTEGRCETNTAVWCENNQIQQQDCSATNKSCGKNDENNNRCIDEDQPCGQETYQGRCDGNTAVWCEDGEIKTQDCESNNETCGLDSENNSRCIDEDQPCGQETYQGRCDGNTAVWCENNQIKTRNCELCNQICGLINQSVGYYCIDQ